MKLLDTLNFISVLLLPILVFSNVQAIQIRKEKVEPIKIGLLISGNNSLEARNGAELAILEANRNIGINDQPFQLITRSMEGLWGTGSKEAVDLIFNENVWAILGSHDGRNAHLVEQVIAKTQIVFLSAWAADPTLSRAFVPWYFSCVPNSHQQASLFINEIGKHRDSETIVTVSDNEYDSELAVKSFVDELKTRNHPGPIQLSYKNANPNYENLVNQIMQSNSSSVVLLGKPSASLKIIEMMRQKKMKQTIFGALSILGEDSVKYFNLASYENVILVNSEYWTGNKGIDFSEKYKKAYGRIPGPAAAYAYDAANVVIAAIKKTNFNRILLKEIMLKIGYEGVTGTVNFDKKGNRAEPGGLVVIKNGRPLAVEK